MEKLKTTIDTTNNSNVYKKALKIYRDRYGIISCTICPYHVGDNDKKHPPRRSWKARYKKKRQWQHGLLTSLGKEVNLYWPEATTKGRYK